jgi:hypothetical protein
VKKEITHEDVVPTLAKGGRGAQWASQGAPVRDKREFDGFCFLGILETRRSFGRKTRWHLQ